MKPYDLRQLADAIERRDDMLAWLQNAQVFDNWGVKIEWHFASSCPGYSLLRDAAQDILNDGGIRLATDRAMRDAEDDVERLTAKVTQPDEDG